MTDEETLAAEYRATMQARYNNDLARYKALAGSKTSYAALYENTKALMHDDGWEPVDYLTEEERDAIN